MAEEGDNISFEGRGSSRSSTLDVPVYERDHSADRASDSPVMSHRPQPSLRPWDLDFRIQSVYFVLGCTGVVPCTLLVTVLPFFRSRVLGSPFAGTFSSYLLIAHNFSEFLFLAHATAVSKSSSPTRQTRLMILAILFLTFLIALSTLVRTSPHAFLIFIMPIAVLSAAGVSYLQSPVFAVASIFGPRAVQAVMAGQAAVSVVVNGVQLVGAALSLHSRRETSVQRRRTPEEVSAFVSLAFTMGFLFVSFVAHGWLIRTPVYARLIAPLERERRLLAAANGPGTEALLASTDIARSVGPGPGPDQETATERMARVARKNIVYEIAVAYVFVVTLSVFPPITMAIEPVNPWFHPLLFTALHVLIFSVGDLFGRHLCSFPSLLIWSPYRLLRLSFAHTLFVPLFIACNIQLSPSRPQPSLLFLHPLGSGPPPSRLINSDLLFFLILFAFGTSNGYVSSLCLMAASSLEHNKELRDKEDVDTAATIGLFCMVGGITLGSFFSLGMRAVVCRCNPFVG